MAAPTVSFAPPAQERFDRLREWEKLTILGLVREVISDHEHGVDHSDSDNKDVSSMPFAPNFKKKCSANAKIVFTIDGDKIQIDWFDVDPPPRGGGFPALRRRNAVVITIVLSDLFWIVRPRNKMIFFTPTCRDIGAEPVLGSNAMRFIVIEHGMRTRTPLSGSLFKRLCRHHPRNFVGSFISRRTTRFESWMDADVMAIATSLRSSMNSTFRFIRRSEMTTAADLTISCRPATWLEGKPEVGADMNTGMMSRATIDREMQSGFPMAIRAYVNSWARALANWFGVEREAIC